MSYLWPDFSEKAPEVNKSLEILRDQAKALDIITKGRVKATFSKTQYKKVPINPDIDSIDIGALFVHGYENIEVFEEELESKKDANALFSTEEYKFEIHNNIYRFRIFKVEYNISYPITIELDNDIAKEIKANKSIVVSSDSELQEKLSAIFASKKLVTIINRIMTE